MTKTYYYWSVTDDCYKPLPQARKFPLAFAPWLPCVIHPTVDSDILAPWTVTELRAGLCAVSGDTPAQCRKRIKTALKSRRKTSTLRFIAERRRIQGKPPRLDEEGQPWRLR